MNRRLAVCSSVHLKPSFHITVRCRKVAGGNLLPSAICHAPGTAVERFKWKRLNLVPQPSCLEYRKIPVTMPVTRRLNGALFIAANFFCKMAAAVDRRFFLKGLLFLALGYMRLRRSKQRIKRKHKCWVRRIFKQRNDHGQFHTLFLELKLHDREFFYR